MFPYLENFSCSCFLLYSCSSSRFHSFVLSLPISIVLIFIRVLFLSVLLFFPLLLFLYFHFSFSLLSFLCRPRLNAVLAFFLHRVVRQFLFHYLNLLSWRYLNSGIRFLVCVPLILVFVFVLLFLFSLLFVCSIFSWKSLSCFLYILVSFIIHMILDFAFTHNLVLISILFLLFLQRLLLLFSFLRLV